ncbi:MAG TPA: transglutaminase-like domain-containing protein [Terriglobales bacterium]|nr:transglutaminase-like domain-containing protein [Terriglobales bacterium]
MSPQRNNAPAAALAEFSALVNRSIEDERIDLARAALAIARTEYPQLDPDSYLARLQGLAQRVRARLTRNPAPPETIASLNTVLFEEERFRGNVADYYDPRNSFLNEVLDRKLGIPITLALVYEEVARRIGLPLFGVGMPGHFLLKHYDVDGGQVILDPFHGGALLTPQECQQRLDQIYSGQMQLQSEFLSSVSRRRWLTRLLNNLKTIYLSGRNFRKALVMADLILAIYPRSPEDVKQRAALRYNLGQMRNALLDFEDYLKMLPEASDADDIRAVILSIRRNLASRN